MNTNFPPILSSYGAFRQHVEGQLKGLQGHGKGDPWQEFTKRLIAVTPFGNRFGPPRDNPKKTRDKGWDISARDEDAKDTLYIQAKYSVNDVNELDGVISSWVPLAGIDEGQLPLENFRGDNAKICFALVTMSDLHSNIVPRYRESRRPPAIYFNMWLDEERVCIIDGPMIFDIFRDHYAKTFAEPQTQILHFASKHVHFDGVWLGVLAASELRGIYETARDSIFFENIRDFIGVSDVNQEIVRTIQETPARFLEMNNGIVFSTSHVTELDEQTLKIDRASIVNGCQTTLALVNTKTHQETYVQVKVVQIGRLEESWRVTKAANFQNEVKRIDLELAMYIRPQVARRQGYLAGVPVRGDNVLDLLDVFNRQPITWRNIRILFIGLFSKEPGNMFDVRWDLVNDRLLANYFQDEAHIQRVFNVVFDLHLAAERAVTWTSEAFAEDPETVNLFSRLLGDTRAPYKQYLIILALCSLTQMDIAERLDILDAEIKRMDILLTKFQEALDAKPKLVDEAFLIAFEKAAGDALEDVRTTDIEEVRRKMYNRITKQAKFTNLYRQVKLGLVRHKRLTEDEA